MSDTAPKKITKTQARYISRKNGSSVGDAGAKAQVVQKDTEPITSVATPTSTPVEVSSNDQEPTERAASEKITELVSAPLEDVPELVVEQVPQQIPINVKSAERSRTLIAGESVSPFFKSLTHERIELIDALLAAGFNHNRFILGNDGYAEEVRHEIHTAIKVREWNTGATFERKEYGYRSWRDIAEEVAQVTVLKKDVLTEALFEAITKQVTLYPSAGTKDMVRRALIDTLVSRVVTKNVSAPLKSLLDEVVRVYFTASGQSYSPFERGLLTKVYEYYGDVPPNTVSHQIVHGGGWSGLKKAVLKGRTVANTSQLHSPQSDLFTLPDIATL